MHVFIRPAARQSAANLPWTQMPSLVLILLWRRHRTVVSWWHGAGVTRLRSPMDGMFMPGHFPVQVLGVFRKESTLTCPVINMHRVSAPLVWTTWQSGPAWDRVG